MSDHSSASASVTRLRLAALTHPGCCRPANEDTVSVAGWSSPERCTEPLDVTVSATGPLVALVVDGLGGHAAGATASRLAADSVSRNAGRLTSIDAVRGVLVETNVAMYAYAACHPEAAGMGATIAGMVIAGPKGFVFNVGDSSVFRVVDGYAGVLTETDRARRLPGQPDDAPTTSVVQCLGGGRVEQSIDPHAYEVVLQPGDRFLICSDGLTDAVTDTGESAALGLDTAQAATGLLEAALQAGGPDNVSIVVVDIITVADDPEPNDQTDPVAQRSPEQREEGRS